MDNIIYHYPTALVSLLIDTIPLLCRSKNRVIMFFREAGVSEDDIGDLAKKVRTDKDSITKYEIVSQVISRINEGGDRTLRQRREVLKRIVEFEDFTTCWPADQLKAKGLVAQIRNEINVKDSFTRMNQAREIELQRHQKQRQAELNQLAKRNQEREQIKNNFYSLFGETNPHKRGKLLEQALNDLFRFSDILIREAFVLVGNEGEGIVEQIDGVVEINGRIYLVEMKWWKDRIGVNEISPHLIRVYGRPDAGGIYISYSGFSGPAISTCRDALNHRVITLCTLQEIVSVLDKEADLKDFLIQKIQGAVIDKDPFASIQV